MSHKLLLTLMITVVFLLTFIGGVTSLIAYNREIDGTLSVVTTQKKSAVLQAPSVTANLIRARAVRRVQSYYDAIERKAYDNAFASFDPDGTLVDTQGKAQNVSVDLITTLDQDMGDLLTYRILSASMQSDGKCEVVVSIQRGNRKMPSDEIVSYTVNLILLPANNGWRIISASGI